MSGFAHCVCDIYMILYVAVPVIFSAVEFHCVSISQFYFFTLVLMGIWVSSFLGAYMHAFLFRIYLGMELLGQGYT